MPTIEIISLESKGTEINQADFDIAIIEETQLESHRGLFNAFIGTYQGSILHLGNPDFKTDKDGGFFAGQLIDWELDLNGNFKFEPKYENEIVSLLEISESKSKTSEFIFLTDIQEEDPTPKFRRFNSINELWDRYQKEGLEWNCAYLVNFRPLSSDLTSEVDWILWNDWDPIGVNDYGGPDDEYRNYVSKIVELLKSECDVIKLMNHLEKLAKSSMGLSGNKEESMRISNLLIETKKKLKRTYNNV